MIEHDWRRLLPQPLTLCVLALLVGGMASYGQDKEALDAGDAGVEVLPEEREDLSFQRTLSFDLTVAEQEAFQKWLPNTYRKLTARQPFHMVALGDSIVDMFSYDDDNGNVIKAYPARFANELAKQFFYTGGVRLIKPEKGKDDKDAPHLGPEITLRNLGRGGKLSLHAMQALTTYGFEGTPDLVLASFGINDSTAALDPGVYAQSMQDVVNTARSVGAEVILLGPTAIISNPPEEFLAATRVYSDTLRDVAKEAGVLYVDLGDLAPLVTVPPEAQRPEEVFRSVVENYRRFFDHGAIEDYVHPRTPFHEILAKLIFKQLIGHVTEMPWELSNPVAQIVSQERLEVEWTVTNRSEEALNVVALPLVMMAWKPLDAAPLLDLEAGQSQVMKVAYGLRSDARINPMPTHEPILRVPVLMRAGADVRIEDLHAELRPAMLLWKLETLFNQQEAVVPANLLVNTSGAPIAGTWLASWNGQETSGAFQLDAGEREELPIRFKLPEFDEAPFNQKEKISVVVNFGTTSLRFDRHLTITKNFGLKQLIPLTSHSAVVSPSLDAAKSGGELVTLRADADNDHLFLVFEMRGIEFQDDVAANMAWFADINFDARSYGKRLQRGATDAVKLWGPAADGPSQVGFINPWTFGPGYAAKFDTAHVKGALSSGTEGVRRITLTLPRSYLYLHEWALGNGNSQIGVNCALGFFVASAPGQAGSYPEDRVFCLSKTRARDEVEALAVLELTEKPTQRWTVSLH